MACIIWDNIGKEDAILITDAKFATSLGDAGLVTLCEAIQWWSVRFLLHAGHINKIKLATFFYTENIRWMGL